MTVMLRKIIVLIFWFLDTDISRIMDVFEIHFLRSEDVVTDDTCGDVAITVLASRIISDLDVMDAVYVGTVSGRTDGVW